MRSPTRAATAPISTGRFAGLPFLMKDLGPTLKGRLQEMGSPLMRGNRAAADTFLTDASARPGST